MAEWKVPFVNYPEHYFRIWDEVRAAIDRCLTRGDLILRDDVEFFERSLAHSLRKRYAIGLNSGTDALWFGLKALGLSSSDEVILPGHTFVASAAAVVHAGARPVLVDVGEDMCMSVEALKGAVNKHTRVVMPVHLNGHCCDMPAIMDVVSDASRRFGREIFVVEDAAQALGAKVDGRLAGTWGVFSAFSFYPAKLLGAAGDAGALVSSDLLVAEKVRLLRDHCINRYSGALVGWGFNSRLDNIQAAILNAKLRYLPRWIERRRKIAEMYFAGLEGVPDLVLPQYDSRRFFDVFQNFVVLHPRRDELEFGLAERGIETMVSWRVPFYKHPALGFGDVSLPMCERVSSMCLSLPMYPELSDSQVRLVVEAVWDCLG